MTPPLCEVCGETRFEGWDFCPACKHPYPPVSDVRDVEDLEDEDEDEDEDEA